MRRFSSSLILLAALAAAPRGRAEEAAVARASSEEEVPAALDERGTLRLRYGLVYLSGSQQDAGPGLSYQGLTPNDFGLQGSWFGEGWLGFFASGEREAFSLLSGSSRVTGGGLARATADAAGRWALGPLRLELNAGYGFSQLAFLGNSLSPAWRPVQRHALDVAARLRLELPLGLRLEARGEVPLALFVHGLGQSASAGGFSVGGALALPLSRGENFGASMLVDVQLVSDRVATSQVASQLGVLRAGVAVEVAWLRPRPQRSTPGGGLELRVLDAETGAPVAGAAVSVRAGATERTADTGVDGRAPVDELPPGPAVASVAVRGYLPAQASGQVQAGQRQSLEVRLQHEPRVGSVAVVVVDKQTGAPIPDALVKVQDREVPAGPTGRVTLTDLPPGPIPILASAEGYKPVQEVASVVVGKQSPVALQLVKASAGLLATLTGLVRSTRGGRPIAAVLEVPEAKVRTRASPAGAFTIRLPGGTYTVVISAPGYLKQNKSITVKDGEEAIFNVDLHPDRHR